ncbi:MAG: hypothetical protein IIT52_03745 [Candidatus Methanomethylophilus sp.]|nr:hypothetical protein [Methanomethylophilus sp.]
MDSKPRDANFILDELIERYPELSVCREDIANAYFILLESYKHQGQLLIAGNGGSAADSDHISGELTKSFMWRAGRGQSR